MIKAAKKNVGRQNSALIYKILLDYASKESPLAIRGKDPSNTIQGKLREEYGVELNHHTVSDILHALMDSELVAIKGGNERGRWYPVREMDEESAAILLLSLYGNNNITQSQIEGIEKLLTPVMGTEFPEHFHKDMAKGTTTWNQRIPSLFFSINDAIKKNKQIGYLKALNTLENTTMGPEKDRARKHIVNPLGITIFRGDLYLVFTRGGKEDVYTIRLDNIWEIEVERTPRIMPENFDMYEWRRYRPYAFSDPIEEFEIKTKASCEGHNQYRDLIYIRQYFGNEPKLWLDENDQCIHAKIKTTRFCFKYWYIGYGTDFTIISPEDIKPTILEHADKLRDKLTANGKDS